MLHSRHSLSHSVDTFPLSNSHLLNSHDLQDIFPDHSHHHVATTHSLFLSPYQQLSKEVGLMSLMLLYPWLSKVKKEGWGDCLYSIPESTAKRQSIHLKTVIIKLQRLPG